MSLVAISFYTLFRMAVITEKCARVPALVNSIPSASAGCEWDTSVGRLVDYIGNSAPGFYVKGVRLTVFMVMKLSYVVGLGTLAVISRLPSSD